MFDPAAMMQVHLDAATRRTEVMIDRFRAAESCHPFDRPMYLRQAREWLAMMDDSLSNAIGWASK